REPQLTKSAQRFGGETVGPVEVAGEEAGVGQCPLGLGDAAWLAQSLVALEALLGEAHRPVVVALVERQIGAAANDVARPPGLAGIVEVGQALLVELLREGELA